MLSPTRWQCHDFKISCWCSKKIALGAAFYKWNKRGETGLNPHHNILVRTHNRLVPFERPQIRVLLLQGLHLVASTLYSDCLTSGTCQTIIPTKNKWPTLFWETLGPSSSETVFARFSVHFWVFWSVQNHYFQMDNMRNMTAQTH